MDLRDKKVLIIGLGKSGFAAAQLAKTKGAEVFVTENGTDGVIEQRSSALRELGIKVETAGHTERFLKKAMDFAVISPGINQKEAFIKNGILKKNIPVISEIELAFNFCRSSKIAAVTGTNGKSTTVELIGHILGQMGRKAVVCGNIGRPFAQCLSEIDEDTHVVLEISSYQLEAIRKFKPAVSAILNITEDHLDRHDSMDAYMRAKMRIFENQGKGDICILNSDDDYTKKNIPHIKNTQVKWFSLSDKNADCFIVQDEIVLRRNMRDMKVLSLAKLPLYGNHNIENTLGAIMVVSFFGDDLSGLNRAVSAFKGLDHRIQPVAGICGVDFIDDSKATNVDAAKRAIESLNGNIILICGGRNKKNDFGKITKTALGKVKFVIAIGESKNEIRDVFKNLIETRFADNLPQAVRMSFERAEEKDCVLLSPMCASFDMFRDYKERGNCFKEAVLKLKEETECAGKE